MSFVTKGDLAGDVGLMALSQIRQTQQLLDEAIQLQAYRSVLALQRLQEPADLDLAKFGMPPPVSRPSVRLESGTQRDECAGGIVEDESGYRLQGTVAEGWAA